MVGLVGPDLGSSWGGALVALGTASGLGAGAGCGGVWDGDPAELGHGLISIMLLGGRGRGHGESSAGRWIAGGGAGV